jgi:hypothetical protein
MLKEINCKQFIENPIIFNSGLNSILGDDYSTNSIGKSTLLMIIDFIFGGSSFLTKNSGSIKELGHLTYNYEFIFDSKSYYFGRNTEFENTVMVCDKDYNIINEIDIKTYTQKLKELYEIKNDSTFRGMVNPYSRIWGKGNDDVDKPIQNFSKEAESAAIDNLIKLFNLFDKISKTSGEIKAQEESKKILQGIHKKNYVQKVNKTEFKKNENEISRISNEIEKIKDNLLEFTLNIEELSNKELIELKTEKSSLLESQSLIQNKINRLELNLDRKSVKSKYFNKLSMFFENPNEEKINKIESFHNSISSILTRELKATLKLLDEENKYFETQIAIINNKISALLENTSSPKFIVEKIYDLTIQSNKIETVNKFYQEKIDVEVNLKDLNETLHSTISDILTEIEEKINNELIRINKEIHSAEKKVPRIKLNKKTYSYDHSSNTGTGKSYADLIEFDLTILKLTELPFIIHDSILFKNIEDIAVEKIIEQYNSFDKQIFIALDGINKFKQKTQNILTENSAIQLSKKRKLYDRDWS